jgi:hypothetical protein
MTIAPRMTENPTAPPEAAIEPPCNHCCMIVEMLNDPFVTVTVPEPVGTI